VPSPPRAPSAHAPRPTARGRIACQSVDDPRHLAFVERWSSVEAHDAHIESPHVKAILGRLEEQSGSALGRAPLALRVARRHDLAVPRRVALVVVPVLLALVALATVIAGRASVPQPQRGADLAFPSAPTDTPAEVWAVGDSADGGDAAQALARLVIRARPDRLLYLGDVYEHGTSEEFERHYAPLYGSLAARTAPTPGNHDWPNHVEGYDRYWQAVTGHATPSWYALRVGGWELISLNSEAPHDAGSAQLRWLRRQLREPGTCRLAYWHRPRYSAGPHGDQADVEPFWDALRRHATLVLGGHDHNMQRFHPSDGMTQLVAGAGGHTPYDLDGDDSRVAYANDTHDGALRLLLSRGAADIAFFDATGRRLDRAAVRCRPLPR
jgi:3',5'-cyclic AMP phosphodiesterase CpdA